MPYNEKLAGRVRELIAVTHHHVKEQKMFSGICFMINEKMCVCVQKNHIMVRLNPDIFAEVAEKEGCKPMEMAGRVMKGFVFVDEVVLKTKKQLNYWVQLALEYNKIAKASKKKTKKKI